MSLEQLGELNNSTPRKYVVESVPLNQLHRSSNGFIIESNVEIPAHRKGTGVNPLQRVAVSLNPGESVGSLTRKERDRLYFYLRQAKKAPVTRKENSGNTYRVWATR